MAWDKDKAAKTLAIYGVRNFSVNSLGMVFVNTGVAEIEIEGITVSNEDAESLEFNPGIETAGDNAGPIEGGSGES